MLTENLLITLRDAGDEDEAFLRAVYASSRDFEMSMVPWKDEQKEAFLRMQFNAQHSYYHAQFPEASYQIILQEAKPIGRLYVLRTSEEIRVMDITLLAQHRNVGIGTSLLRDIMQEADQAGQAVNIWVENYNPSLTLFARLGFAKTQEEGVNYLLEYRKAVNGK